jgi:hypothetical protein
VIDLRSARNDPEGFRAAVARKGAAETFDALLAADERWRSLVPRVDELRGRLKLKGKPTPAELDELNRVKDELRTVEDELAAAEAERDRAIEQRDAAEAERAKLEGNLSQLTATMQDDRIKLAFAEEQWHARAEESEGIRGQLWDVGPDRDDLTWNAIVEWLKERSQRRDRALRWISSLRSQNATLARALEAAERQRDQATAALERLGGYVQHKQRCYFWVIEQPRVDGSGPLPLDEGECSCGLAAALAASPATEGQRPLPTTESLAGSDPDFTRGLSTQEFMDRIRGRGFPSATEGD